LNWWSPTKQTYNKLNELNSKLMDDKITPPHHAHNVNLFSDHYEYWRAKRVVAIVEYYGQEWFKGKKILELGCGFGDIGKVFKSLGAEVVFAEGRKENCEVLMRKFPNDRIYQINLENEWPFQKERFDLILHMGVLYHLNINIFL
jgi:2-polyprenyl-3-methyl-5-hydroxy-6-metoxy-1,4-benzoquinol methylase